MTIMAIPRLGTHREHGYRIAIEDRDDVAGENERMR
jgi:hypothetical protein